MAHPQEKREEVRGLYVYGQHDLERAAQIAGIPLATARSWKSTAKNKGDDWDKYRAAALRATGGEQTLATSVYTQLMMILENVINELHEQQDVDVLEKAKTLIGLGDTLSKVTAIGTKLMPNVNSLAIAMEAFRMIGDDIRENAPELAPKLIERLEAIGAKLHERFG